MKGNVKAFILVNVRSGYEDTSLERIRDLPEVDAVDAIFGKFDIHVTVYFDTLDQLDDFVMNRLRTIEGVYQTTTLLSIEM